MNFAEAMENARRNPADAVAMALLAEAALAEQEEAAALPTVEAAAGRTGTNAQLWQWAGLLHRALDEHVSAIPAFEAAARLAPHDGLIAHGRARVALEAGLPAVALFEAAHRLSPTDGDLLLGLAAARVAEGDSAGAIIGLQSLLDQHPGWIAGHQQLAQLRWMMGDQSGFAASFERALAGAPRDPALWQSLIILLIHAERFDDALAAIRRGRAALGEAAFLDANEAVAHSETGAVAAADACFARVSGLHDISLGVRAVRHQLRTGRMEAALAGVEAWIDDAGAALMWPYAAIAWRITDDPRWKWLEGDEAFVSVVDLGDRLPALDSLAHVLRGLHRARDQHLDQSVRGGTQTDGPLFSRIEPEIRALRAAIVEAVEAHIAQLPPADARHPTLAHRRDRTPRFSGSWSVRLRGQGHHANHTHPAGWLSSALYVALPSAKERGADQAGWLTLGEPQAELGLDLPPVRLVEPKPGRLVLFPSTMWHGTVPFDSGERLTVAFDILTPLQ